MKAATLDKITFTPYMRALLLDEICSRMDIVSYCKFLLNITLTQSIKNTHTGDCPYCSGHQAFIINSTSGKYFCINCRAEGDFLTLLMKKDSRDLNSTLEILSGYLEEKEKSRPAYAGGVR